MKTFYITTPIYYVNDKPHIGHAYTTVAADVLARYHRLIGNNVFFLTGTDEHGAKIEKAAIETNMQPQEFCNQKADDYKKAWRLLNISYDNFIRTSDTTHIAVVQRILQNFYDQGLIYKSEYEGLYCEGCEQYLTKSDLVNGKCPDHKIKPQLMKEETYFYKLSQFQDDLINKIKNNELAIEPEERKNEVLSFLKKDLNDISISRTKVKWGVSLPFDETHTTYVWIDAFLNYLTGLGWKGNPKDLPKQWPADLHLIGKDILRVHATIWPGMLLGLGIILPKKIFAHGHFSINGQKMSKSLGNVIWPKDLVEKFGVDGVRYLLISIMPFGYDGDISWEKFKEKYNADLANGLGNLVARVFNIVEKNYRGKISKTKFTTKFEKELAWNRKEIDQLFNQLKFYEILQKTREAVVWANQKIDQEKLWELVKSKPDKAQIILEQLIALIKEITEVLQPFIPETSKKILDTIESAKIKKGKPLFVRIK